MAQLDLLLLLLLSSLSFFFILLSLLLNYLSNELQLHALLLQVILEPCLPDAWHGLGVHEVLKDPLLKVFHADLMCAEDLAD